MCTWLTTAVFKVQLIQSKPHSGHLLSEHHALLLSLKTENLGQCKSAGAGQDGALCGSGLSSLLSLCSFGWRSGASQCILKSV